MTLLVRSEATEISKIQDGGSIIGLYESSCIYYICISKKEDENLTVLSEFSNKLLAVLEYRTVVNAYLDELELDAS